MARMSVEARAAAAFRSGATPPKPPSHLSKEAKAVWNDVVTSRPVDWFDSGSLPLLEAYCDTYARLLPAREELERAGLTQMGQKGPQPSAELQAVKILTSQLIALATKLRLSVQASVPHITGASKEKTPNLANSLLGGNIVTLGQKAA